MARVLKGRYFKNKDIIKAEMGSNPSYVWRSLTWGKELLRNGLCWKVGNMLTIRVHQDPWIPNLSAFKSNCQHILNMNRKVNHYLNDNGPWNEPMIRRTFSVFEAEAILNIPLNRRVARIFGISKDTNTKLKRDTIWRLIVLPPSFTIYSTRLFLVEGSMETSNTP